MKPLTIAWALALSVSSSHGVSLINLSFSGSMTATQQQTFVDAAAFWNSAITGYDLTTNIYGQYQPHTLTINASIPSLDGIGGTLGSAGPQTATYYDNNPYGTPTVALYYTTTGSMQFDSADVPALVANNTFYGVVLHEMAHVLGIGTLWTYNSNLDNTTYPIYTVGSGQYTGPNALAQYRSEFSQPLATYVPVELAGGSGTANAHWNEVDGGLSPTGIVSVSHGMDLQDELMTGWASGNFFLSRTTLGSLDDLGYIVDYSKAGIVNHIVVVPELSSISLCLLGGALLFRRRR
jgi:Leishmanolysin